MDMQKLKDAFEIVKMMDEGTKQHTRKDGNGRPVIVRSRDAGVQFGYLEGYEGSTVYLKNARQMWSWSAAEGGTLFDCATHGVKGGKFSTFADSVIIIGACAIIDCTETAVKSLESATWN